MITNTYGDFEDDDDGHDGPDSMGAKKRVGGLEEDQEEDEGQGEGHLQGMNGLGGIFGENRPRQAAIARDFRRR